MHCVHVVHVGLMGNLHYVEILDWLLGWAGWDICGDDYATRLAQREAAAKPPPEDAAWPDEGPSQKPDRRSRKSDREADISPLDGQP